MNELVIMHDKQAVTTSLKVAASFEKNHRDVMRSIKNLTAQNCAVGNMFAESTYVNKQSHEQPMFYMNRDGFTLLAMGFNVFELYNSSSNTLKRLTRWNK